MVSASGGLDWPECKLLRTHGCAFYIRTTYFSGCFDRCQMLRLQSGVLSTSPNVLNAERLTRHNRQSESGADDLSASLTIRTVNCDQLASITRML